MTWGNLNPDVATSSWPVGPRPMDMRVAATSPALKVPMKPVEPMDMFGEMLRICIYIYMFYLHKDWVVCGRKLLGGEVHNMHVLSMVCSFLYVFICLFKELSCKLARQQLVSVFKNGVMYWRDPFWGLWRSLTGFSTLPAFPFSRKENHLNLL